MRTLEPDDPRHGTANAYANYECRCDKCRTGWAKYLKGRRELYKQHPERVPHGTQSGYHLWSCRCALCTTAAGHNPNLSRAVLAELRREAAELVLVSGRSAFSVARELGTTVTTITKGLRELGYGGAAELRTLKAAERSLGNDLDRLRTLCERGEYSHDERDELIRLARRDGNTLEGIAQVVGVSKERVRQICEGKVW